MGIFPTMRPPKKDCDVFLPIWYVVTGTPGWLAAVLLSSSQCLAGNAAAR